MAPPTKSTKVATRGAKQILEENVSTLNFYRNMVFIASGVYLVIMIVFFEFTPLTISLTLLSAVTYVTSYQFMMYMARAKYSESGQLIDSGVDLNMEGGIAEHIKDLIILTSGCQVLSLTSNYFWCLWTLTACFLFRRQSGVSTCCGQNSSHPGFSPLLNLSRIWTRKNNEN
ncbi:transmembrane protein 208 isoform X2 [Fopius arisanus]|uniref:Transmembrane protein 208 n=1 Tax=Fopius arisanus TaxID=64838 RepID=A0A9R1U772_9HYME|nr:PREDICTED: transmembrane protein 208 isoform X2 [Fopius arisanus]